MQGFGVAGGERILGKKTASSYDASLGPLRGLVSLLRRQLLP
jgi:hypothetical protein